MGLVRDTCPLLWDALWLPLYQISLERRASATIKRGADTIIFYLGQITSRSEEELHHHLVTPYSSRSKINTTPRQDVGVLPHHEDPEPG
jgi:hypothetical protein